ncbi:hypothetical protein AX16_004678 [Volvariella volvacea WC 439]|nr:hypothetical protein AX16_004678 [Volvariella volvacea WC 439]
MLQQFAHVPSTEPYRHAMTTGSTQVRAYSTSSKGRRPDHVSAGDSSQRSLVPNTSYDSTALNNQDILKVSRHMVEKHSTNVQRDEICLKYLQHKCLYGPQCHRIHPRNPGIYVTALLLNSTHTPRDLPTRSQTDQSPAAHKALGISSHTNAPRRSVSPSPTTFGVSGDSSGAEDDWYSRPSWECHTEHEAWFRDPGASSTSESDLSTDAAIETGPSQTGNSPNLGRVHRKPPPDEMCWEWLRNRCARGYACKYRHGDLEYDDSPVAIPSPQARPELRPSEPVDVTLHEYTKLKLADGFEILDLVTGFDTQWITINNLPAKITQSQVLELVKPYGTVLSVKFPPRSTQSRVLVKLCMGNAAEAQQAYSALNGKNAFKSRLTVSLPVTDYSNRNGYVDSTIVRVDWQAPCKVAYAGYASLEEAQTAISAIDRCPMGDIYVRAYIHHGLPQLGFATTRLEHVPADANVQQLKEFTSSLDAAWERPQNDVPATRAIDGIRRNLAQAGKLVSFEPEPPPYKGGTVRAWARYETSAQALKAVDSMNGRKPGFTKLTRIYVTHMHGIAYPLTSENYAKAKDDIEQWHTFISERRWRTSSVSISNTSKDTVNVKLYNVTRQGLCHMKGVFEEILFGEVIRDKGRPVWDIYFEHPSGLEFLKQLEQRYSGTAITRDLSRRTLKVHGPSQHRGAVRSAVIRHLASLNSQTVRRISIQDNVMRGLIIRSGLKDLQNEFGTDAINVDLWNRAIVVRAPRTVLYAFLALLLLYAFRVDTSGAVRASQPTSHHLDISLSPVSATTPNVQPGSPPLSPVKSSHQNSLTLSYTELVRPTQCGNALLVFSVSVLTAMSSIMTALTVRTETEERLCSKIG